MLFSKNNINILIVLLISPITFGDKVDEFTDQTIGTASGSVNINNELTGITTERLNLDPQGYSFHDHNTPDLNRKLLYYSENSEDAPSVISYRLSNDFDLKAKPIFQFNFLNIHGQESSMKVILTDVNGGTRTSRKRELMQDNLNLSIDLTQEGNFEDSGNAFSLYQVRSFDFIMNADSVDSTGFELDSIEVIPEPFSIISLGIGLTGFVKKRRKKVQTLLNYKGN